MINFIIAGTIAILFLLIGFAVGQSSRKKSKEEYPDYIPSCLNCSNLKYHSPEIDINERYHYRCSIYGHFNCAPDVCGSYELNKKYKNPIVRCKDCTYFEHTTDGSGEYMCYRFNFIPTKDDYCSNGKRITSNKGDHLRCL